MEQAGRDVVLNPLGKRPNSCVPHPGGPARVCDGTKNSQPSSWERGKGVWLLQRRQRGAVEVSTSENGAAPSHRTTSSTTTLWADVKPPQITSNLTVCDRQRETFAASRPSTRIPNIANLAKESFENAKLMQFSCRRGRLRAGERDWAGPLPTSLLPQQTSDPGRLTGLICPAHMSQHPGSSPDTVEDPQTHPDLATKRDP
ncbi:hypothetical protein B0J14DRAFT_557046 [Halenospora varia]|nr:hypothetical protein B0J14DRAFT_557046 [Halenospora varia]